MIEATFKIYCVDCQEEVFQTTGTVSECILVVKRMDYDSQEPRCEECRRKHEEKNFQEDMASTRGAWGAE